MKHLFRKTTTDTATLDEQGFTIIELTIATIIFALVMLMLVLGVLQITHQYYKGITISTTQNSARSVLDLISQDLQLGSATYQTLNPTGDGVKGFCIGNQRFSYVQGYQLVTGAVGGHQTKYALLVDTPPKCDNEPGAGPQDIRSAGFTPNPGSKELLAPNMRVVALDVTQKYTGSNDIFLYTIHLRVAYGDNILLCDPNSTPDDCQSSADNFTTYSANPLTIPKDLACKGQEGEQFCNVTDLTTQVVNRLQ